MEWGKRQMGNENYGPQTAFSDEIHRTKYREEGETFRESMNRVAGALADDPEHFRQLQDILLNQRFLPGGRIQASMGAAKTVSPINCFLSGVVTDSFVHDDGNIMQRATEAAATMRLGGGIGTDFSTLRPSGANIVKLDSASSGPVSFMHIFDAVGRAVASSGHRRGAQMGVIRVDHPDIVEFIHAKNDNHSLTGFNMSVLVTDEFMRAVEADTTFDLKFDGKVYKTVRATSIWNSIMRSTYDYAEPGVIFIDTINDRNSLNYAEEIIGTNPCGEVPLPPHGACLLGSLNLVKYIGKSGGMDWFDWFMFQNDIHTAVRALDNVIERASVWPLPQQEAEMKAKRRIGLGVTGLANAAEALGKPYGSEEMVEWTGDVMSVLRNEAFLASSNIASEKGSFPAYDAELYTEGEFFRSLPCWVRSIIEKNGLRNSHLIAIAPTGTISLAADNVSSGIEPVFSHRFDRTVNLPEGQRVETVEDYGVRVFGVEGRTANELSPEEHLAVLAKVSYFTDQAVSKTINVAQDIPWEDFKGVYMDAWKQGCKGVTTFRIGGMRGAILEEKKGDEVEEGSACSMDEQTGRWECS